MSSPSNPQGEGTKPRRPYRRNDRWARRVLEALHVPTKERNDERDIDVATKRVDTGLDFVDHPVPALLGRLAERRRGRLVGVELCAGPGSRRAWIDAGVKAGLLFFLDERRGRTPPVAMVHVVVGSSNRFAALLDAHMQKGPWDWGGGISRNSTASTIGYWTPSVCPRVPARRCGDSLRTSIHWG